MLYSWWAHVIGQVASMAISGAVIGFGFGFKDPDGPIMNAWLCALVFGIGVGVPAGTYYWFKEWRAIKRSKTAKH